MTHFGRLVSLFVTLNHRNVDGDSVETRLFFAWMGTVACALNLPTMVAQQRAMFAGAELDDHAMRLTVRELTEAARAVAVPEAVATEWRGALDALAIVADRVCNDLPRKAAPVPTPDRDAN